MQLKRWIKKTAVQCIVGLLIVSSVLSKSSVSALQEVDVEVVLSPKIDLVLTTGISEVDLSHFEEDLIAALEKLGVDTQNTDMVEISAIETTSASLESTSVDFVSVVNQWKTVGADTWSATPAGEIYSKTPGGESKPAWWGTGIINPDGFEIDDLKAEFKLVNGGKLNEGFCFNVTENADGSLNGYFISYSNHTNQVRALFRFDHYTLDQKFDGGINNLMWCYDRNGWNVGKTHIYGNDRFTSLATWNDAGKDINYEVTCKNGQIVIKDNGTVVANVTDNTYPKGTYGFWGNNCEMADFSYVSNLKITATKTVSKDYAQVLLEPKWRAEAAHFVVNVEDPINESLNNPEALARTLADNIHFIQWGSDANKASAEDFIAKNDENGMYCDSNDYTTAVNNTARYIKEIIDRMQRSNAQYVLVGENIELVVTPESIKVGAVSELFPTGRWLIHHDPSAFDNDEGQSPLTEVFQPDLLCAFDKPGKYEIMFDNEKVKEVYVHRKPVADFNIGIQDGRVSLTSASYDLDSNEDVGYGPGIAEEKWYYKRDIDADWTSGKLQTLHANEVYIIKLEVTDQQKASVETIKYVGIGAPVSNFGLGTNLISTADHLDVLDYSYDPQGYNLNGYEWVLKKGTATVGTYTSREFPNLNFNDASLGEGDYSLSLKVTNTAGDSSGVFTQTFKVETARYNNQFIHYAVGFQNKEGNTEDGAKLLLQTTYASQTYGTSFVPASKALAIPNGYSLETKYVTNDQKQDINTALTQPANALELIFQYAPVEYTVEYDLDGGILEEENAASYSVLYGSPLNNPTKEHHTFLGWYDQNGKKHESLNDGVVNEFKNTADFYSKLARRTSGNLKLTARWEHRVYQITGTKYGHGTISKGGTVGEGEEMTISWMPDEGYIVSRVMINGTVRDDLLNEGAGNSITFSNITENYTVRAEFSKIEEEGPEEEKEYFTISTEQRGGSQEAKISNSKTLAKGSDFVVEWEPGESDVIESITVDGQDYPIEKRSVEFKQIAKDHKVIVIYKAKEEADPMPSTEGYYTITVSSQNGDANRVNTSVTGSAVIKPHENHTVSWRAQNGYEVEAIWIDRGSGSEIRLSEEAIGSGSYSFTDVSANHGVEVIFKKADEEPGESKKQVQIKTELVGGPGEITESAVLNEGENYKVEWDSVVKTTEDVEAADYAVYQVSEVLVNGESVDLENNHVQLTDIQENQTVRVVMEPLLHQVETEIVGNGTIDPTATLYDGQNYVVKAYPEEGWVLKSVIVDERAEYTKPEGQANQLEENILLERESAEDAEQIVEEKMENAVPVEEESMEADPEVVEEASESSEEEENTLDEVNNESDSAEDIEESVEPKSLADELQPAPLTLVQAANEVVVNVNDQESVPVNVQVSGITQNHKIRVEFIREDGVEEDTTKYLNITGRIEGGPGTFAGSGQVAPGAQKTLSWSVPEGYEVGSVIVKVNGVQRNDLPIVGNTLELADIQDNYDVTVSLKKSGGESNQPDPSEPEQKKWAVITAITNGEGEITQSTYDLSNGSEWTVDWDYDEERFVIKEVRVDGITDDSYLNQKQITFQNLSSDHTVEIVLTSKQSPQNPNINKKEQVLISTERTQGGTIDPSVRVEKGSDHNVKWEAEAGYRVALVTVDGIRRKDLLDKNVVEFMNVGQDHHVAVVFVKEGEDAPNQEDLYQITTGIAAGKGVIDSSVSVPSDSDQIIHWNPSEGYKVKTVLIDGRVRDDLADTTQYEFEKIQADHSIHVLFEKIESVDGGDDEKKEDEEELFTIETSREGKGTISPSVVLSKGESYVIRWEAAPGYVVGRIEIDGVVCPELLGENSIELGSIGADHQINVIFDRVDGETVDPKNLVSIRTKASGGKGQISGSFSAEIGETVIVEWQAEKGYYASKVYVNKEEVVFSGNQLVLENVDQDMEIEVVFMSERNLVTPTDVPVVNTEDGGQRGLYLVTMMLAMIGMIVLRSSRFAKEELEN